jgi:hypothetical protein
MLRQLPEITASSDFHQRLQHRIYHLQDENALAPERALRSWLAVAAGVALLAGSMVVLQAVDQEAGGRPVAAGGGEQHDVALASSWTPPPVPASVPGVSFPAFTDYTPVVVRRPLYQPVSYELLSGE